MNDLQVTRTPEMVAAEINLIKDQTRKLVLSNSILIGKKLKEVKEMLEPGQFGKWLTEAVDFSQSTANNLMRVYDEYGADQGVLFGSAAKSDVVEKLTYTQAVLLLGVPAEQREDFIKEAHVEDISTRELQAEIKKLKMAKEAAEAKAEADHKLTRKTEEKLAKVSRQAEELSMQLAGVAESKKIVEAMSSQRDVLVAEAEELRKNLYNREQETAILEERIKELEELLSKLAESENDAGAQKEALELKVEIWAVLNGINKLLEHLDKVQDGKRGAGVCKALASALAQSQNQITKRLAKFEQEG